MTQIDASPPIMNKILLKKKLAEWVQLKEANGITQHSDAWLEAKVYTIGGSSLATIQGKNPYSNIYKLLSEKIGLTHFISDIKPQWGNLFEDVIKRYVEHDRDCEILGEDLYVPGPTGTAYSPDGLCVLDVDFEYMFEDETYVEMDGVRQKRVEMTVKTITKTVIVLVEFKCPQSRIPSGSCPEYYVPQMKMGLDIFNDIASIGLFIEGVFRRCSWDDLGNNPRFDRTLVPRSSGKLPLAFGIIGFYIDNTKFEEYLEYVRGNPGRLTANALIKMKEQLIANYVDHFVEYGDDSNGYMCNDLGDSPVEIFTQIMNAYDKKIVTPWYGGIAFVDTNMVTNNGKATEEQMNSKLTQLGTQYTEDSGAHVVNDDMTKYTEFCRANNHINLGILPWKLFRIDYNYIHKEQNYLKPWLPKINEIIDVARKCLDPKNVSTRANIYNSYVNKNSNEGFIE